MKLSRNVELLAVLIVLAGLALSACNLPQDAGEILPDWLGRATVTATEPTLQVNLTPQIEIPPGGTEEPCGYVWATQPLPEVSDDLQKYFTEAGFLEVKVTAEAFGENCLRADGSVSRFLTMYTDIRVTLPVEQLNDTQTLAAQAEAILRLVLDYPPERLPGSLEGYLGITFVDSQAQVENLWFRRLDGKQALDQGMTGEELLLYLRRN